MTRATTSSIDVLGPRLGGFAAPGGGAQCGPIGRALGGGGGMLPPYGPSPLGLVKEPARCSPPKNGHSLVEYEPEPCGPSWSPKRGSPPGRWKAGPAP